MNELMPCPFCGGEAHFFYSTQRVVCLSCEACAQEHVWNMRTITAQQSRAPYVVENLSSDKSESMQKPTPSDS